MASGPTKICSECKQEKAYPEFTKDKRTSDGLGYWCRDCANEAKRKWRKANTEHVQSYANAWNAKNAHKARERTRRYVQKHPDKVAAARHERQGIVWAPGQTVAGLLEAQSGRCAICPKVLTGGRDTCVDHDHDKAPGLPNVRGILCRKCNIGLGCFQDCSAILMTAVDYLRKGYDV